MTSVVGAAELERAIAECAREPIHIPGATQPFGAAIVVDATSRITDASASVERWLEVPAERMLGARLSEVLAGALRPVEARMAGLRPDQVVRANITLSSAKVFEVDTWRRPDGAAVLSLVPSVGGPSSTLVEELGELQHHLASTESLGELCDRTATSVRELSGYDRVMVYKFDAEGNGVVLSEALRAGMDPYLGLHYPASDIPAQARALFLRNRTRLLADTRATPDALIALEASLPPADLSICLVRAASPVHLTYLQNMGVRASLTVSIVTTDGKLWGLVACHHLAPRVPTVRVRLLSELLGEVIAVRLQLQEELDLRKADAHAAQAYHAMVGLLATSGSGWAERVAMSASPPHLTDLVASGGAACLAAGTVRVVGDAPPADVIRTLPQVLEPRLVDAMFHASSVDEVPALAAHAGSASGVVAVRLAADDAAWLFWFRPERIRSVAWAGKPEKDVVVEQGVARLSPRQSFAAWTQEQRGRAEPWTLTDIAAVRRVRQAVVDHLLRLHAVTVAAAELGLLRVRRACEASTLPLAVLDTQGQPVFLNAAWTSLLGPPAPEVAASLQVGAHFAGPIVREQLRQVLAGHASSYASEAELARTPAVPVLITIDAVRTDRGLPAGAVVVVTDLRERTRREEERLQTRARIDQADRTAALGLVTGAVAHDFNNLLTAILCETALLADDLVAEGPQRDGLERIERTARRAADLCRQLLAYAGKGTFVVRRTDLVVLAHDVLAALRSLLPPGVVVSIRTISPMLHVVVDADQVRQVLMNLILNAAEASVDGRKDVEVFLETAQLAAPRVFGSATEPVPSGAYAVMRVIDHGAGIPEASHPRIFEPFFTTKRTGKGLGLATVLGIVRSHRGIVEVESREGTGSRFSVWLPAAPAVQRDSSRPPAPTITRILVVEDEPAARVVVRRILEREGYVVVTAADVATARAILANAALDLALVFTDLGLPDGSGRDVLAAASARDRGLPVILTSGMNHALEPLSEGTPNLVAFLPKPFGRTDLIEAIARGLERGGG